MKHFTKKTQKLLTRVVLMALMVLILFKDLFAIFA